jgi:hypothetical protein
MEPSQQPSSSKLFLRASARRRITAALVFLAIAAVFLLAWLMGRYHITLYPFPCGFKQRYGLPCPTCGMTTSVLAFAQGQIIRSFYIQPAAAFFCALAVAAAFFALLTAVFGIYSPILERRLASLKLRYIVAALLFVLAAGWAVTLARALAENAGY